MKAKFFRSKPGELGLHLEPESYEEELILELWHKFGGGAPLKFEIYVYEMGGEFRYPDGMLRSVRGIKARVTREEPCASETGPSSPTP